MKLTHKILLLLTLPILSFSQTHNTFHQTLVDQVQTNNINQNLQQFVGFGVKSTGSQALVNAKNWIINHYQTLGYENIETQNVSVQGQTVHNIIVTKTGTTYPDQYIIIDGHYDTANGPGANDNGSGTAVIMEIARILQNVPTEYSIKFIHFTAEEIGLIGSTQYVNNIVVPQNLDIKLVFNIDQVGGVANQTNNRIYCERDVDWPTSNNQASNTATQQLATLMQLYSTLNTTISNAYSSDYMPFQEEGYTITGLYEYNESPFTHSPQDTFERIDPNFIYQVTKGALGALCFFSKAYSNMNVSDVNKNQVQIYPNPAKNWVHIDLKQNDQTQFNLYNSAGNLIKSGSLKPNQNLIDTSYLLDDVYLLNLINQDFNITEKLIIKK